MNNEPVAYINEKDGLVCAKCYKPFKTLTDEEILQEAWYILATKWQRKAQEK